MKESKINEAATDALRGRQLSCTFHMFSGMGPTTTRGEILAVYDHPNFWTNILIYEEGVGELAMPITSELLTQLIEQGEVKGIVPEFSVMPITWAIS